tara:strand:- start:7 stop:432 length:426 start_codon:yes stop_codon:yes gene_type:complete
MIDNNKGKNMTTIQPRNFNDTKVPRTFKLYGGYYNDQNEYVENGSTTLNVYQYAHNANDLYEANTNQTRLNLQDYVVDNGEAALFKGIPMKYRWNPVIREAMMTGKYRIKYRGTSKKTLGYKRMQNYCLAEYADTFAIYYK